MKVKIFVKRDDFILDINTDLPSYGVTVIYGPSGAGKTTLLRSIAGLEKNLIGLIKVGNNVWQEDNFFLPVHKRSLGFVFQDPSLFDHLSVKENIEYGLRRTSTLENNNLTDESIELLNSREKEIILSRNLSDKKTTLDLIGKKLNISKERVRQIESAALKKLKKNIIQISKQPKDFFIN